MVSWLNMKQITTYRDTPEFEAAMDVWRPVVIQKHRTPREWKRFVNRVPYYAMREQRSKEADDQWIPKTPLERLVAALSGWKNGDAARARRDKAAAAGKNELTGAVADEPAQGGRDAPIPADVLVALAAIKECHPGAMDDGDGGRMVWSKSLEERKVAAAVDRHRARFKGRDGDFLGAHRSRFLEISREILVR